MAVGVKTYYKCWPGPISHKAGPTVRSVTLVAIENLMEQPSDQGGSCLSLSQSRSRLTMKNHKAAVKMAPVASPISANMYRVS